MINPKKKKTERPLLPVYIITTYTINHSYNSTPVLLQSASSNSTSYPQLTAHTSCSMRGFIALLHKKMSNGD